MTTNTITGFDGSAIKLHSRVEMHPGTDFWMRGARFGTVIVLNPITEKVRVKLDRIRSAIKVDGTAIRCIDEPALSDGEIVAAVQASAPHVLVTGRGYWGRGATVEEAITNAKFLDKGDAVIRADCSPVARVDEVGHAYGLLGDWTHGKVVRKRGVGLTFKANEVQPS